MGDTKRYVTVADVPLIRVGTWDASTGESSITLEDLENIVTASASTDLNLAVVKIGHLDPRMENPDWDGEPAYGQVTNLRVTDDKEGTLLGDLVNVPEDLAAKLASAYPYRSVEIAWGVKLKDSHGKVVADFPAVLTGLALLGRSEPAVSGLGSIHADLSKRAVAMMARSEYSVSQFAFPGGLTNDSLRKLLQDALWAGTGNGADVYDRWVEDYDDTRVWYSLGGKVWQETYAVDQSGVLSFGGDAVQVVEKRTFVPVQETPVFPHPGTSMTHDKSKTPTQAKKRTIEESNAMAFTDKQLAVLRKQYSLPGDTTEEDVLKALDAAFDAESVEGVESTEGDTKVETPAAVVPPLPTREPVAAAAATEDKTSVVVSAASFAALQESNTNLSAQLKVVQDAENTRRRDGIIAKAFASGRLHSTEREVWRNQLDTNEEVTATLLAARTPVFPVVEVGSDQAPEAMSAAKVLSDAQTAAEDALFGLDTEGGK